MHIHTHVRGSHTHHNICTQQSCTETKHFVSCVCLFAINFLPVCVDGVYTGGKNEKKKNINHKNTTPKQNKKPKQQMNWDARHGKKHQHVLICWCCHTMRIVYIILCIMCLPL